MRAPPTLITTFFLRAILGLLVCLGIWHFFKSWFVQPALWLSSTVMLAFFPDWVLQVKGTEEERVILVTTLKVIDQAGRAGQLAIPVVPGLYTYGLSLLAALLIASRARGLFWKLPLGAVLLLPFQAWGICMGWLVQVAVQVGEATRGQTGFSSTHANLIAIGYQLGFLLFPVLLPLIIWAGFERGFLRSVVIEGAFMQRGEILDHQEKIKTGID